MSARPRLWWWSSFPWPGSMLLNLAQHGQQYNCSIQQPLSQPLLFVLTDHLFSQDQSKLGKQRSRPTQRNSTQATSTCAEHFCKHFLEKGLLSWHLHAQGWQKQVKGCWKWSLKVRSRSWWSLRRDQVCPGTTAMSDGSKPCMLNR